MKHVINLFLLLGLSTGFVVASDLKKEQRWVEQVVDYIIEGEAEFLDLGKHKALAIYTEADEPKGGVIVIHGSGVHPNWEDIVHPLRTRLPESGWSTLSIQMPVLRNEAEYHEYAPLFDDVPERINAAISNLQAKGITNIHIVAHSLGSAMTAYYLSKNSQAPVKSFVAIGMPGEREDARMNTLLTLQKINLPVLDLYGEKDLETVVNSAAKRKQASQHNKGYQRQVVAEAGHFFAGQNDALLEAVNGWLVKQP